jgi:hypothetical protein
MDFPLPIGFIRSQGSLPSLSRVTKYLKVDSLQAFERQFPITGNLVQPTNSGSYAPTRPFHRIGSLLPISGFQHLRGPYAPILTEWIKCASPSASMTHDSSVPYTGFQCDDNPVRAQGTGGG